jgi:hypothetical protein
MVHEITTTLPPADVFARAKTFFAERVPHTAAFPEREGATFLLLRGQGGEDIALSARETGGGTHVRGSTLMFDQALGRFLTTLPPVAMEQS